MKILLNFLHKIVTLVDNDGYVLFSCCLDQNPGEEFKVVEFELLTCKCELKTKNLSSIDYVGYIG